MIYANGAIAIPLAIAVGALAVTSLPETKTIGAGPVAFACAVVAGRTMRGTIPCDDAVTCAVVTPSVMIAAGADAMALVCALGVSTLMSALGAEALAVATASLVLSTRFSFTLGVGAVAVT